MAAVIKRVKQVTFRGVWAVVEHAGEVLEAEVIGDPARLRASVGQSLGVEFEFDSVAGWRVLAADSPAMHGLYDQGSGSVRVLGGVHHVVPIDDGTSLVDVCIQRGPEFLTIHSTDLGDGLPRVGDGVELVVRGLRVYPTWT